jgi:hypothetical protein
VLRSYPQPNFGRTRRITRISRSTNQDAISRPQHPFLEVQHSLDSLGDTVPSKYEPNVVKPLTRELLQERGKTTSQEVATALPQGFS